MMCLGILFTQSDPYERAEAFYTLISPELEDSINIDNINLKIYFAKLVQLSALFIVEIFKKSYLDLASSKRDKTEDYRNYISKEKEQRLYFLKDFQKTLNWITIQMYDEFLL
jgi:phenolic acid decarboxylase